MRSAMIRFLRTPPAIALAESLISSPFGIDLLSANQKCLRCRVHTLGGLNRAIDHSQAVEENKIGNDGQELLQTRTNRIRIRRCRVQPRDGAPLSIQSPPPPEGNCIPTEYASPNEPDSIRWRSITLSNFLEEPATSLGKWHLNSEKLDFESDVGHS